jgi:CBS domain containing-hemolysin-like protein
MPSNDQAPVNVDAVMVPVETGCLLHNFAQDVVDVLEQLDREYMPVVDSFARCHPLGVVTRTDLRRITQSSEDALVSDALIAAVPHIRTGTGLHELSDRVTRASIALVVDGAGSLAGYLETAVVVAHLTRTDEQGNQGSDA